MNFSDMNFSDMNFSDMNFSDMNFSGYPDMQPPGPYSNDSGISLDAGIDFNLYGNATSHSYYQGHQSLAMCPLNSDTMSRESSGGSNDSGYVSMNNSPVPVPDTMAFVRDDCPPATNGSAPHDLQQATTTPFGLTPEEIARFTRAVGPTIDTVDDFDTRCRKFGLSVGQRNEGDSKLYQDRVRLQLGSGEGSGREPGVESKPVVTRRSSS
jgi:hypothetical protein